MIPLVSPSNSRPSPQQAEEVLTSSKEPIQTRTELEETTQINLHLRGVLADANNRIEKLEEQQRQASVGSIRPAYSESQPNTTDGCPINQLNQTRAGVVTAKAEADHLRSQTLTLHHQLDDKRPARTHLAPGSITSIQLPGKNFDLEPSTRTAEDVTCPSRSFSPTSYETLKLVNDHLRTQCDALSGTLAKEREAFEEERKRWRKFKRRYAARLLAQGPANPAPVFNTTDARRQELQDENILAPVCDSTDPKCVVDRLRLTSEPSPGPGDARNRISLVSRGMYACILPSRPGVHRSTYVDTRVFPDLNQPHASTQNLYGQLTQPLSKSSTGSDADQFFKAQNSDAPPSMAIVPLTSDHGDPLLTVSHKVASQSGLRIQASFPEQANVPHQDRSISKPSPALLALNMPVSHRATYVAPEVQACRCTRTDSMDPPRPILDSAPHVISSDSEETVSKHKTPDRDRNLNLSGCMSPLRPREDQEECAGILDETDHVSESKQRESPGAIPGLGRVASRSTGCSDSEANRPHPPSHQKQSIGQQPQTRLGPSHASIKRLKVPEASAVNAFRSPILSRTTLAHISTPPSALPEPKWIRYSDRQARLGKSVWRGLESNSPPASTTKADAKMLSSNHFRNKEIVLPEPDRPERRSNPGKTLARLSKSALNTNHTAQKEYAQIELLDLKSRGSMTWQNDVSSAFQPSTPPSRRKVKRKASTSQLSGGSGVCDATSKPAIPFVCRDLGLPPTPIAPRTFPHSSPISSGRHPSSQASNSNHKSPTSSRHNHKKKPKGTKVEKEELPAHNPDKKSRRETLKRVPSEVYPGENFMREIHKKRREGLDRSRVKSRSTLHGSESKDRSLGGTAHGVTSRFEIDAEGNFGVGHVFEEVARGKDVRKLMHGADCECCSAVSAPFERDKGLVIFHYLDYEG